MRISNTTPPCRYECGFSIICRHTWDEDGCNECILIIGVVPVSKSIYRIAGNFRREKTFADGGK